ncbi:hypothetical protein JCM10212_001166 [Sporobolomyces blumeae]
MDPSAHAQLVLAMQSEGGGGAPAECGNTSPYNGNMGLRVGAIFIILATSAVGTLFPIVSRRTRLPLSEKVYLAFKMFGSGVLVATAFIHLLAPAFDALTSPCLSGTWTEYDWAPALSMVAVFSIFTVELVAHRWGASYLRTRGLKPHDPHKATARPGDVVVHTTHGTHVEDAADGQGALARRATGADVDRIRTIEDEERAPARSTGHGQRDVPKLVDVDDGLPPSPSSKDVDGTSSPSADLVVSSLSRNAPSPASRSRSHSHAHGPDSDPDHPHDTIDESSLAQILGVAILEFGVIFHSFIIGLTLSVNAEFVPLFCVLIFHQMFEGIGLGSRLSGLPLPQSLNWVPVFGAILYACITPLGIAIGLGIRTIYNPESTTASIVSGVLDACSSGILLWAGLVECLSHDFVFDRKMSEASNGEVAYCLFFVFFGAGLMALLGRWA